MSISERCLPLTLLPFFTGLHPNCALILSTCLNDLQSWPYTSLPALLSMPVSLFIGKPFTRALQAGRLDFSKSSSLLGNGG